MTVAVVEDRKEFNRIQINALSRWIAVGLVAPALLLALVLAGLTRSPVIALAALVLGYAVPAGWLYSAGRRVSATLIARFDLEVADETRHARLHNVAEGLCAAHGLTKPDLHLLRSEALNACTISTISMGDRDNKQAALILTTGLYEALSRIELEGVLSQQLSHIRDEDTALSTFVSGVAELPLIGRVVASRASSCLDPDLEQHADLVGSSVTRYPPGLADALEEVSRHSTVVAGVAPSMAHMWLADPLPLRVHGGGDGPAIDEPFVPHPPLGDRIAVLREL